MFSSLSLSNKIVIKDKSRTQNKYTLPNESSMQYSGVWSMAVCQMWTACRVLWTILWPGIYLGTRLGEDWQQSYSVAVSTCLLHNNWPECTNLKSPLLFTCCGYLTTGILSWKKSGRMKMRRMWPGCNLVSYLFYPSVYKLCDLCEVPRNGMAWLQYVILEYSSDSFLKLLNSLQMRQMEWLPLKWNVSL